MTLEEFDEMLKLLQNPTRRRILDILSREEHYPLQLSRALNSSQQAVSKHLKDMEDKGIVVSKVSKSERGGPPTRRYTVNRKFSLRIDIGPSLFETRMDNIAGKRVKEYSHLEDRLDVGTDDRFLEESRRLIEDIDSEMKELEKKRKYLLSLKERTLDKAFSYIHDNFDNYLQRNVLYYVIRSGRTDPKIIARDLHMREDDVELLINEIKEELDIW